MCACCGGTYCSGLKRTSKTTGARLLRRASHRCFLFSGSLVGGSLHTREKFSALSMVVGAVVVEVQAGFTVDRTCTPSQHEGVVTLDVTLCNGPCGWVHRASSPKADTTLRAFHPPNRNPKPESLSHKTSSSITSSPSSYIPNPMILLWPCTSFSADLSTSLARYPINTPRSLTRDIPRP